MNIDQEKNEFRNFFKKWPRFYYFITYFFGPVVFLGLSPKKFVKKYKKSERDLVINLGSGPRIIEKNVKNIDLFPYKGVDIVADINQLPFKDNSVNLIILDNVLEHIPNTKKVVDEIYRVLKIGGKAYICVPFIYPFHASPYDFRRFSHIGLREEFKQFIVIEEGVRSGFFSSLNALLIYLPAHFFSFGNEKLYWILVNISIFLFFPIKFLDYLFIWLPKSLNTASVIYCTFEKNE